MFENVWLFSFVFASFIIVMAIIIFVLMKRDGSKLKALETQLKVTEEQLEETQEEFDGYKGNVSDHFVKTADLVNNLTQAYKEVYDHLELGAFDLVGEETLQKRLVASRMMMLGNGSESDDANTDATPTDANTVTAEATTVAQGAPVVDVNPIVNESQSSLEESTPPESTKRDNLEQENSEYISTAHGLDGDGTQLGVANVDENLETASVQSLTEPVSDISQAPSDPLPQPTNESTKSDEVDDTSSETLSSNCLADNVEDMVSKAEDAKDASSVNQAVN